MDWTKESQDMLKSWTDAQKRIWDGWIQNLQGTGRSAAADTWQKTIEAWQASMNDVFEAQARLTKLWIDGMKSARTGTGAPAQWAESMQEMIQRLQDTQRQLWEGCFKALKAVDPRNPPGSWEQEARELFQHWQDTARRAMEAQAELVAKLGKR